MFKSKNRVTVEIFGLNRWKKQLISITFDGFVSSFSLFLAFLMRVENPSFLFEKDIYIGTLIAASTTVAVFAYRKLYNTFTRHISLTEIFTIAVGSTLSCLILLSCILLFELQIPRSVPLIYLALLSILAPSGRLLIRALAQINKGTKTENVAIYGAGEAGIQLLANLRKNPSYNVRLIIDDKPELDGQSLSGVPIKNLNEAGKKFLELKIEALLLAIPSDTEAIRTRVFEILGDYPLKVQSIPSISSLISKENYITEFKDINIDDLLGRQPVSHDAKSMGQHIIGKTVFVTGAGGSIGSELCRQILSFGPKTLVMLDVSEFSIYTLLEELKRRPTTNTVKIIPVIGSIQDRELLKKVFDQFDIDTTYHAAAYKHVPLMEQNVMQCISNNVFGTLNLVEIVIAAKIKNFILVSSDKAVNPTSIMGASKRLAEMICQILPGKKTTTKFSIVRFGNVLGSSGSVVPLFKKQIESGGPITITHPEVTRYFMTTTEAAQLVIQAGSLINEGNIFVLDMGPSLKILDLAKKMAALAGLKPILGESKLLQDNEIGITFCGLRPGEKLFEELSFHPNMIGTSHSRINTVAETVVSHAELFKVLTDIKTAIHQDNYPKFFKAISTVAGSVSDFNSSSDNFISHTNRGVQRAVEPPKREV